MIARLIVLLLVACGPAIPPVPSKGGPAWRELTSEHFTLWTNASSERARELVRGMEDLRHVVIGIGFRGGGAGRVFVIALRDDAETRAFMPGDFAAVASPANSYIHQPMIVLSAESRDTIVAHELTHTISQTVLKKQQRWFAEGLADFFETIEIDRDRGRVDLGRAPTYRGQPVVIARLMPLRQMVKCDDLSCVDKHFYASAWALFTYLWNAKRLDFAAMEAFVASANLDELETELKQWLANSSHTILHFNVRLPTYPVTERQLGDADVHAVRALMRLQFQDRRDLAMQEVAAARASERTHVLANLVAFVIDKSIDADTARAIAKAHPDDWRAWMLVVAGVGSGDEARAAFERACALSAANPALSPPWRNCPPPT